jgi:hypothetical protein
MVVHGIMETHGIMPHGMFLSKMEGQFEISREKVP